MAFPLTADLHVLLSRLVLVICVWRVPKVDLLLLQLVLQLCHQIQFCHCLKIC